MNELISYVNFLHWAPQFLAGLDLKTKITILKAPIQVQFYFFLCPWVDNPILHLQASYTSLWYSVILFYQSTA